MTNTHQVLTVIQVILSLVLIGLIILQSKGTGLGSTFGGGIEFYGTKRGAEKYLFILTIIVSILFLVSALLGVILP
jgi:protein translocase SecG subunit